MSCNAEGLDDVIIYTNPDDPSKKNRGFAFLEFDSHKSAGNARRKIVSTPIFGVEVIVNWAEPQYEPDEEAMSKVCFLIIFWCMGISWFTAGKSSYLDFQILGRMTVLSCKC